MIPEDNQCGLEKAEFLSAVKDLGHGTEIPDAALALTVDVTRSAPSPWGSSDPFAAERYLAGRGLAPALAASNAAEFEIQMRALVGVSLGRPVGSFNEITDWVAKHIDGAS